MDLLRAVRDTGFFRQPSQILGLKSQDPDLTPHARPGGFSEICRRAGGGEADDLALERAPASHDARTVGCPVSGTSVDSAPRSPASTRL